MRVLHVQKSSGLGGSERHLLSLLPSLMERGIQVEMCVLRGPQADRFVVPLRNIGVPTTELSAGPDLNPILVARIIKRIRDFKPDLVHTHLIHGDLYGQVAARLTKTPAVSSLHASMTFYESQPYRGLAGLIGKLPKRTIAISEHVARFAERFGLASKENIRVVRYGIDAGAWTSSPQSRESLRKELGFTESDVVAGVASRLVGFKGHDFLIKAMALASPKAPNLKLVVAGDGPLLDEMKQLANELLPSGKVLFLGFWEDVKSLFKALDFLVFPTLVGYGEGFGLGTIETMAAGRPVIANRIHSLPEIVEDGKSGFLVSPDTPDELAEKLILLASDSELRKRLGVNARARVVSEFSLDAMVERTVQVYEDCISL